METSQIRHTRKRLADDSFTKNYHLKRGLTSAATTISVDPPKNPVIEAKNAVKANYSAATRLRIQQLRNSRMSGVVSSAVKSPPVNDKENDGFGMLLYSFIILLFNNCSCFIFLHVSKSFIFF